MLQFNPNTGFSVSEISDIRDEVAQDWVEAFKEEGKPELNTDPETPQGQIIDSETAAVHQKDTELAFLAQMFNPQTASGRWQDALAKIYFLNRKPAINSSVVCTLTGLANTVVSAGSQIRSSYDQTVWTLAETVTIGANGKAEGRFTCLSEGAIQAGPGTLTQIVTAVPGWDMVTNPAAAEVGQLAESQSAFESRRYRSVALNSRGTTSAVYARVAETSGVIATYVTDNKANTPKQVDGYTLKPHSIFVAVIGGADQDIADAMYHSVSAGCDYNGNTSVKVKDLNSGAIETVLFQRPVQMPIYVRIFLQDDGALPNGYEATIKEAVIANFYGSDTSATIQGNAILRATMNSDVYSSRFMPSILNRGINQILRVELSKDNKTWTDFVHIPIDKDPVITNDEITVTVQK